jgi:asparagine synthase (glutamine-hydrolysing)
LQDTGLERDFGFIPSFTNTCTGKPTLDFAALNVFFRTGMFLEGATPFREIRRNLPAPVMVPHTDISRDAAIDGYIELFRQAVKRRASRPSAIGLSGGADSRHILLELHRQQNVPEYAMTAAIYGRSEEVEISRRVAEAVGCRHVIVTPDPKSAVRDELEANLATSFMYPGYGWLMEIGRRRDDLPYWDGIAGDVMSAGLFLEPWNLQLYEQGRLDEFADRFVIRAPVPFFRDQSLSSPCFLARTPW